jgi:hypothetical protein
MKTNNLINVGWYPYLKRAGFALLFVLSFLLAGNAWAAVAPVLTGTSGTWNTTGIDYDGSGGADVATQNDAVTLSNSASAKVTLTSDVSLTSLNITGDDTNPIVIDLATYTLTVGTLTWTGSGTDGTVITLNVNQGELNVTTAIDMSGFNTGGAADAVQIGDGGSIVSTPAIDFGPGGAGVGGMADASDFVVADGASASITSSAAINLMAVTLTAGNGNTTLLSLNAATDADITFEGVITGGGAGTEAIAIDNGDIIAPTGVGDLAAVEMLYLNGTDDADIILDDWGTVTLNTTNSNSEITLNNLTVVGAVGAVTATFADDLDIQCKGTLGVASGATGAAALTFGADNTVELVGAVTVNTATAANAATLTFGSGNEVSMLSTLAVTDAAGGAAATLAVGATNDIDVTGNVTLTNALMTMGANADFATEGDIATTITTVINSGKNAATLSCDNLTVTGNATAAAAVTINDNTTFNATGDVTLDGTNNAHATLTFGEDTGANGCDVNITGDVTMKSTGGAGDAENATINFWDNSDVDIAGSMTLTGDGANGCAVNTLLFGHQTTFDIAGTTAIDYSTGDLTIATGNVADEPVVNFNGPLNITEGGTLTLTTLNATTLNVNAGLGADWSMPTGGAFTIKQLTLNDSDGDATDKIILPPAQNSTFDNLIITKGEVEAGITTNADVIINDTLTIANDAEAVLTATGADGQWADLTFGDGDLFVSTIGALGTIATNQYTRLIVADKAEDVTLPSSITALNMIDGATTNSINLSGDLTLTADALSTTVNGMDFGTLVVGDGNTLYVKGAGEATLVVATAGGTVDLTGATFDIDEEGTTAAFTGLDVPTYISDRNTNLYLMIDVTGARVIPTSFDECDSLRFSSGTNVDATLRLPATFHAYGNMGIVQNAAGTNALTIDAATNTTTLTVDGKLYGNDNDVSDANATLNAAGATLNMNGEVQFDKLTILSNTSTTYNFGGTGDLTIFPGNVAAGDFTIGTITYDRPGKELQLSNAGNLITLSNLVVNGGTVSYKDEGAAGTVELVVEEDVTVAQNGELILGATTIGGNSVNATFCTEQNARLTVVGEMFLYGDIVNGRYLNFELGTSDAGTGDPTSPTPPVNTNFSDNGGLQVTGTFAANEAVNVALCMTNYGDDKSVQLNLPATFDRCNNFIISTAAASTMNYTVKLQNDLNVAGTLQLIGAGSGSQSILQTAKNGLVVGSTATQNNVTISANGTLDASEGTLEIHGRLITADDLSTNFICNENTDLIFHDELTLGSAATHNMYEINSLSLLDDYDVGAVAPTMFTLEQDLICHGHLDVRNNVNAAESTLDVAGYNVTVYGDVVSSVANAGAIAFNFSAAGSELNAYGNMYDTDNGTTIVLAELWSSANTNLSLNVIEGTEGSADVLTLPTGLTAIKELTVERTSGVKMFGDLTVGTLAGDSIDIQRGNIDLNGKNNITMGNVNVVLAEVGGYVVNNGVDGGYITTAATSTLAQAIASGIGVTAGEVTTTGTTPTIQVRRYPKMTIIEGDDFDTRIGVKRYYDVVEDGGANAIKSLTFRINDDELGNNSFSGLEVYRKTTAGEAPIKFTSSVLLIEDGTQTSYDLTHNSSYDGYGTVEIDFDGGTNTLLAAGARAGFAFASQNTSNGEIITFTDGGGTGLWNDAANWDLSRIPTIDDEVIINTPVLMSETAGCFEANTVYLTGTGSLRPSSGDTVCVQMMGDLTLLDADNYIHCQNGTGRLNFFFGDEDSEPVSVEINPGADYDSDSGIRFHDVTLNNANVLQLGTDLDVQITGDLSLNGVSVYDGGQNKFTFFGGYEAQQDIEVQGIASVSFNDLIIDNNADVYTNASISVDSKIELTSAAASFTQESANGVPAYFNIAATSAVDGWDVFEGAYCQFDNLTMSAAAVNITPYGDVYVMGDFSFTGTGGGVFKHNENPGVVAGDQGSHPDGNAVIFANTSAVSNIEHGSANANQLLFDEIKVLRNCVVKTVADFYINRAIYVENDAEFLANAGTITLDEGDNNVDDIFIENLSSNTLMFYNLNLDDAASATTTYTYSDFNVQGDLTITVANSALNCYDGTVTFNNTSTKNIYNDNNRTLNFHKIYIPDAGRLTTDDPFSITNNGDDDEYKSDAGIEVAATGSFIQKKGDLDGQTRVLFTNLPIANESNPGTGNPKTIVVAEGGVLDLYRIEVANEPNNDVTTESNFTIGAGGTTQGNANGNSYGAAILINYADLGGTFTASNGSTITFDGDEPHETTETQTFTWVAIENTRGANDNLVLDNVVISGINMELEADDYLTITGDLTINGDDDATEVQFAQTANGTANQARLKFSGLEQQKITGSTISTTPVVFNGVEIFKTGTTTTDKELLMELDVEFENDNNITFYLTEGFLNLGSDSLKLYDFASAAFDQNTNGADIFGAINGGTGTLVIAEALASEHRFLRDMTFTVDNEPTLYNLDINVDEDIDGDLTINNDLQLDAKLDITGSSTNQEIVTLWGDMATTVASGNDAISGNNTGTLKLLGTGTIDNFSSDTYVSSSTGWPVNLHIGRAEVLSDDLTLGVSGANGQVDLTIDCGVSVFDLSGKTFDMTEVNEITRISGSITANAASEVIWSEVDPVMPANFFTNEECGTIDLEAVATAALDFTLEGDLKVNTEAKGVLNIYTGANTLEYGSGVLVPVFGANGHIIGNLRQTLSKGSTIEFPVGDGTVATYRPLTFSTQSTLTEQTILVSSSNTDPTYGRGGEPADAVNVTWTITPEGTIANDNVEITWSWNKAMEDGSMSIGTNAGAGRVTAAIWNDSYMRWDDQFDNLETFILTNASDPRSLGTDGTILPISSIGGDWGVFTWAQESSSITDVDTEVAQTATSQRNDATSTVKNRVQISRITNLPVGGSEKAQMTVQLQDQYGQPITTESAFEFTVKEVIGAGGTAWDPNYTNIIPAGETSVTFDLNYTAAQARIQFVADTTGGSDRWLPTTSQVFASLADDPTIQANSIVISNVTASSADISFANGNNDVNTVLMIKADGLLETTEYPTDGVTYESNSLLGAGSSIGRASVIYNGYNAGGSTVNTSVYGLAPMTQYYVYAFNYADATTGAAIAEGSEGYSTKSALNNPKPFTTIGTVDDDLAYGNNDSRAYAKSIGTNSPVRGTIKTTSDEDWYCFTVTSAAKNIRATLIDLPGNYNFDIYNISERRLRRAIRQNDNPEAAVVNDLPPGTYVIRVYGTDGAFSTTDTYELMIETKGSEVFSVTP